MREIAGLRATLRPDLRFSIQEQGGRRICIIEDPAASRFHRVGLDEYCFLRTLDGSTSVATLIAMKARQSEGETLTDGEAMQILHWARANHLLTLESDGAAPKREHAQEALQAVATWLNPLSVRVPLGRPDAFFRAAAERLGFLLNGYGLLIWCVVLIAGLAHLAPEWARFGREANGFLAPDNWLWISLGWVMLKAVHEFAHGLICRHFGAPVREVGVMFILGLPLGYVDATASLALPSRGRRMLVASAGLGAEFFVAALAAIVWSRTSPGSLHTLAHDLVITGTVLTLFFNANPLMRYDGYFIAADLLDHPNLATRGRQWVARAQRWLLLGGAALRPEWPISRAEWMEAFYGTAAAVWQVIIMAGLLMAASMLLRGGGLVFAVIAAVLWLATPLTRTAQMLVSAIRSGSSGWWTLLGRLALGGGLAAALLFIPWKRSVSEPAVIGLAEEETLRAECPGFVERVLVQDGAEVAEGALLLELRNDEAASQLTRARQELQQQELRARLAYTRQDVATFQAETAKSASLRDSVAQQESYLATLQVRAPFAGRVTNRHLAAMGGVFLKSGEEIIRIGRAGGSEIKIAVSEHNEPHFRAALGQPLTLRLGGRGRTLHATLTRLDAHASREVTWPALTMLTGGLVALRKTEAGSEELDPLSPKGSSPGYELAEPFFTGTAQVASENLALLPGETGQVCFRASAAVNLWQELSTGLDHWMAKYLHRAT